MSSNFYIFFLVICWTVIVANFAWFVFGTWPLAVINLVAGSVCLATTLNFMSYMRDRSGR